MVCPLSYDAFPYSGSAVGTSTFRRHPERCRRSEASEVVPTRMLLVLCFCSVVDRFQAGGSYSMYSKEGGTLRVSHFSASVPVLHAGCVPALKVGRPGPGEYKEQRRMTLICFLH